MSDSSPLSPSTYDLPPSRAAKRSARRAAYVPPPAPADLTAMPTRWAVEASPTDQPLPSIMLFLIATLLRTYEDATDARFSELLRLADLRPDGSAMSAGQRRAYERELARRGDIMRGVSKGWWAQFGGYFLADITSWEEADDDATADDAADVETVGGDAE